MNLNEKAAYLKGLAEGLNYDQTTAEGKLLAAVIDLLGEVTDAIADVDADLETLNDYCEELDEDLGALEEYVMGDDCCDCDDCDCCDCDCFEDEEFCNCEDCDEDEDQ